MRSDWTHLEPYRKSIGEYVSKTGETFGWFIWRRGGTQIRAMAVDGSETGWEHVSVSVAYSAGGKMWTPRTPKWDEMCWIKAQFWNPSECVVEFHPPQKDYVNTHEHCLHLWKSVDQTFPLPPTILV